MHIRILAFMVLVSLLGLSPHTYAAPEEQQPLQMSAQKTNIRLPRYVCGMLCLYAFAQYHDKEIPLSALLDTSFLRKNGSSLAQLKEAAEAVGLYALPIKNISYAFLQNTPYEVVLHVKLNQSAKDYNHFVLFRGMQGNNLHVVDLPKKPFLLPFSDFLARSDGYGLILSTTPLSSSQVSSSIWRAEKVRVAIILLLLVASAATWRFVSFSKKRLTAASCMQQMFIILAVAITAALFYHTLFSAGILRAHAATEQIVDAHFTNFLPTLSREDMAKIVQEQSATIIDSRHRKDYELGHLFGAINLPIDSIGDDFEQRVAGIRKDGRLVVYCQSSACPYAAIVARELKSYGFMNVHLFRGGWREWRMNKSE